MDTPDSSYALVDEPYFDEALRLFEALGNKAGQADAHLDLAQMFSSVNQPRDALPHAERGLELAIETGALRVQAKALAQELGPEDVVLHLQAGGMVEPVVGRRALAGAPQLHRASSSSQAARSYTQMLWMRS